MKFTKKPKTSNMVWDSERNKLLCSFSNNVFETEDEYTIKRLKDLGYQSDEAPVAPKATKARTTKK